jgi:RNA polymerase sigma factor for flagellar operon FliA
MMAAAARNSAVDQLIMQYRGLPRSTALALNVHLPGLDLEDLIAAGNIGLCKAANSYDPARPTSFKTWAITLIRGEIREMLRGWNFLPRSVVDKIRLQKQKSDTGSQNDIVPDLGISLDAYQSALGNDTSFTLRDVLSDGATAPEALAIADETRRVIAAAIDRLPDRERELVHLYYFERLTFKAIGAKFGISESRAYQLHAQAIKRLQQDGALGELFCQD